MILLRNSYIVHSLDQYEVLPFYELIQIPNLTDECFIQFLLKIDANDINSTIWQNIRKRFCVANETTIHKSSSLRYGSVFYDGDESAFMG